MKITILTQYYPPEVGAPQNRLSELAIRLKRKGADVHVITAMPNYPHMRVADGYRGKWRVSEEIEGIRVTRCWIYVPKSKSVFPRLLNYFSFVFSSFWIGLVRMKRSDFLICESPPLFLGITAFLLTRLKRTKMIFNVSDLWPESAEKLGLVTNKMFLSMATALEMFLYRRSFIVTGQTQGIVRNISARVPGKIVYWLPNSVDVALYDPAKIVACDRSKYGLTSDDKVFFYGGIIGHAQGLEVILRAAVLVSDLPNVKFILLGEGPEKEKLKSMKAELALDNVIFLDAVSKSEMPSILKMIDASIIPLRRLDLFKGAIPSKIFESLSMEKPIILGVEGEATELFIDEGKAGVNFIPEDADSLAEQIRHVITSSVELDQMGKNGRQYVGLKFERDKVASGFYLLMQANSK